MRGVKILQSGTFHKKSTGTITYQSKVVTDVTNIGTWKVGDAIKSRGYDDIIQIGTVTDIDVENKTLTLSFECSTSRSNSDLWHAWYSDLK